MQAEEHDPQATVWRAVSELERKRYTKEEISDALFESVETLDQEHFSSESLSK